MPAVVSWRTVSATAWPPSSFTASAPASFNSEPALRSASEVLTWKDMKGMSAITSARLAARLTISVW